MSRSISLSLGAMMLLVASNADANCTWVTGAGSNNGCGDSCADICKNPGVQSAYYDDTDPNFSLMSVNPFNWSAYAQLPVEDQPPLGIGSGANFYQSIYPQYNTVFPYTWNTWLPRGPVSDSNDPVQIDYFRDPDDKAFSSGLWHDEGSSDPNASGFGKPSASELCYATSFSMAWMWAHNNRASAVQIVANNWADKYFFSGNPTSGVVTPYAGTGASPSALLDQTRAFNSSYTDATRRCGGGPGGMSTGGGDGCNTRETLQRIANVATYTHTSAAHGLHTKGDSGSYFMTEDQSLEGCPYGGLNCKMNFQNISYYLYRNNGAHLPYSRFFNSASSSPGLTFGDMKWSADHGYSTTLHRNNVNVTCDRALPSPGGSGMPPAGKYLQFCQVNETVGGSGHYVAFVGYDNRPGLKKIVYVNPIGAQYTVETNINNDLLDFEMGKFYGSAGDPNCNGTTSSKPYRMYNWVPESGHAQIGYFVLSGIHGDGYETTSQCNLVDGYGYKVYDDMDGMILSGS